jgi:septum formation protein
MLILASASPRRREILTAAGIPFRVVVPGIEEAPEPGESPEDYVRRLARDKARALACGETDIILAADTVVAVEGHILEKPRDEADARRMLAMLSGRRHRVITGVCLRTAQREIVDLECTMVRFVDLTPQEIELYVASGEPLDKAGAYAIQGLASKFIDRIEGCYFNVVGLPVARVYRHLKTLWSEPSRSSSV